MSARHLAGCDTRGGNWICAAGCPVAAQRNVDRAVFPVDYDPDVPAPVGSDDSQSEAVAELRGAWVVYYADRSAVWVYVDELRAMRKGVEASAQVRWLPEGESL